MLNRARAIVAIVIVLGMIGNNVQAQNDFEEDGTITIQVFNCPSDVNRDSYDPAECSPTVEGFDFQVTYNVGQTTLALADTSFDGETFTWSGLLVAPALDSGEGDPTYYHIEQTQLPEGYNDYVVEGANRYGSNDELETDFMTRLVFDQPDQYFAVYNFVEMPPEVEPATITITAFICPPGHEFIGPDEDDCGGSPASGEWFRAARAGEALLGSNVLDHQD